MRLKDHLEEEVSPDYVKDLECYQEAIEDVVGGEELNVPGGVVQGGVEDVRGVDGAPGDHPDQGEDGKDGITSPLVVDVAEHLGQLQQRVSHVVKDHHEGSLIQIVSPLPCVL